MVKGSVKPISEHRSQLGESPIWCQRTKSLLWVDIQRGLLLRYYTETEAIVTVKVPTLTSAVTLTEQENCFLLVNIVGLYLYDFSSDKLLLFHTFNFDDPDLRTNEASISPEGDLVFSIMDKTVKASKGAFYYFNAATGKAVLLKDQLWIPNTLTWFGEEMVFADPYQQVFYMINLQSGVEKQFSVSYTNDGSALTRDGLLFNACWGSHKIAIYDLNNNFKEIGEIQLPAQQPTSVVFGGKDLTTLYITSAYDELGTSQAADGQTFVIESNYKGQSQNLFKWRREDYE